MFGSISRSTKQSYSPASTTKVLRKFSILIEVPISVPIILLPIFTLAQSKNMKLRNQQLFEISCIRLIYHVPMTGETTRAILQTIGRFERDVLWFQIPMNISEFIEFSESIHEHKEHFTNLSEVSVVFQIAPQGYFIPLNAQCNMIEANQNSFQLSQMLSVGKGCFA